MLQYLIGEKRAPHATCARADTDADGTRAELNQFEVLLCLPTAPALPLKETETSVGPRFLGNSQTSYCLSFVRTWGYPTQSTRAGGEFRRCGYGQILKINLCR